MQIYTLFAEEADLSSPATIATARTIVDLYLEEAGRPAVQWEVGGDLAGHGVVVR